MFHPSQDCCFHYIKQESRAVAKKPCDIALSTRSIFHLEFRDDRIGADRCKIIWSGYNSVRDRQTDRWTVGRLNIAYHALQSNRAVKTIVMHDKLINGNAMVLGWHRSEAQTHWFTVIDTEVKMKTEVTQTLPAPLVFSSSFCQYNGANSDRLCTAPC